MIATRKKLYPAVLAVLQQNASRCMDDADDQHHLAVALTEAFNDTVYHPSNQEPQRKLRNEYAAMLENLTSTQHRSSQLLLALRVAYSELVCATVPDDAVFGAFRAVLNGGDWKDPR